MIRDVRTETPFWLMKNGLMEPYPSLTEDLTVDFAILGGGVSGALQAWHLSKKGASVALVDRGHIGMGSTAASTALLQYDIDKSLHELIEIFGTQKAVRAYEMSLNALLNLEKIAEQLKIENHYEQRTSVYLAKTDNDASFLEKEFKARKKYGLDVELWDGKTVEKNFPFSAPAAIYTKPSGIVDPYRLTHGLLQEALENGARIFDKTEALSIEQISNGIKLHTSQGYKISAKKLVIAGGYESVNYIPFHLVSLTSTYAIISKSLLQNTLWFENCVFWDTGDPYIYGRTTNDNRIIFGGGDEPFYNPKRREKLLKKKTKELTQRFENIFPEIPFKVDFSWAGTFAETEDGLPYIGSIKQLPNTYFSLGYGGNGITFSQIGAEILSDLLMGVKNKDAEIYSFDRKK